MAWTASNAMQGYNHSNKYRFKYSLRPESLLRSVAAGKTAWELACTVDCMKYAICTSFSPSNSLLKCTKCTLLVKCNNLYEQRARSTVWELVECTICSMQQSFQKDQILSGTRGLIEWWTIFEEYNRQLQTNMSWELKPLRVPTGACSQ